MHTQQLEEPSQLLSRPQLKNIQTYPKIRYLKREPRKHLVFFRSFGIKVCYIPKASEASQGDPEMEVVLGLE